MSYDLVKVLECGVEAMKNEMIRQGIEHTGLYFGINPMPKEMLDGSGLLCIEGVFRCVPATQVDEMMFCNIEA
jgi:hypothetical protein